MIKLRALHDRILSSLPDYYKYEYIDSAFSICS